MKSEFHEISSYLNQMRSSRVLSRDEEFLLAERARAGNVVARQTLIANNLPFVVAIAGKYLNRGARLDDLIQEGNIGLLKSIERYEPKRGNRFATYSVWWIRAYILRYLKDNSSLVRGGAHYRGGMRDQSLDFAGGDPDGSPGLSDVLAADGLGPEEVYSGEETDVRVRLALALARERIGQMGWDIVQQRLSHDEPATPEQIGQRWGVSRERVRQIEVKTKHFLRSYLAPLGPSSGSQAAAASRA